MHDGQGHMRIQVCAPGYDIVRIPQNPELDQCNRCLAGKYSLKQAYIDEVTLAPPIEPACLPCPSGSVCEGTGVMTKSGYWKYGEMMCPKYACQVQANGASKCDVQRCFKLQESGKRNGTRAVSKDAECLPEDGCSVRSIVMKCPAGACNGGECDVNGRNQSCCAPGRTGPLCAVCEPGLVLIRNECRGCVEASLTVSSVFLAIGLIIAWYVLAWRPVFETKEYKMNPMHMLAYVLLKVYALYRCATACLRRKHVKTSERLINADKGKTLAKSLQGAFVTLYNTAKKKGVMSYIKVCALVVHAGYVREGLYIPARTLVHMPLSVVHKYVGIPVKPH
jgi:hypothetical protein